MIYIETSTTNENKAERAILAGLNAASMPRDDRSTEISMSELAALCETAGGEPVAFALQNKPSPDSKTFLGEGKVEELRELIEAEQLDLAIFDNELSPSQMRNLGEALGVKVLDRPGLILDIFAQRARTREGQLQVELAQYEYLLPRLTGMWKHLVRQTAAGSSSPIGTRGPGETQLESDRRHIRRKIQKLKEELAELRRVRATQRELRERNGVPIIALVGYTNAGKSTLMNLFTDAGIPANNRLFDTLDTTTRRIDLAESGEALISDTVGFIRKLPHQLIDAFKATLEELQYADLLLHVIDISSDDWPEQSEIVERLISEVGASGRPILRVYNKCDLYFGELPREKDSVCVSAKTGDGTQELIDAIKRFLNEGRSAVTLEVPYDDMGIITLLHDAGAVRSQTYEADFVEVNAEVSEEMFFKVRKYVRKD